MLLFYHTVFAISIVLCTNELPNVLLVFFNVGVADFACRWVLFLVDFVLVKDSRCLCLSLRRLYPVSPRSPRSILSSPSSVLELFILLSSELETIFSYPLFVSLGA